MVHSTKSGTCKVFTRKDEKRYNDAYRDRTQFTDYEVAWFGLGDSDGYGDDEEKNLKVDTSPIDPRTEPKSNKIKVTGEKVSE